MNRSVRTAALSLVLVSASALVPARAQSTLPAGWPSRIELGMANGPGGAAAMKATAPFAFRYQYLAGGVNTGSGWATWNTNGDFPRYYIEDSIANGIIPVFTYYQMVQSSPGGGSESDAVYNNLNNVATMTAYYSDLKLFFQKAGAFPGKLIVLHVEPDLWGFIQNRFGDDARTVSAKVSETALPELAGLPGNVSGFARAVLRLRNTYAPNVVLGYHISVWGTGHDLILSNPADAMVDTLGSRAAAFYASLAASFDLAFAEFSDRDAAFYQYVHGDGGQRWMDAADFRRLARFLGRFSATTGKRIVMWQIPLGNTKMRAVNNTWAHYQDNRPEWFLDEPSRSHLNAYRDAGIVAFLFGGGAGGTTCACNANNDGVTNPPPISSNTMASESAPAGTAPFEVMRGSTPTLVTPHAADDDGGFFRWKAWRYYQDGAVPIAMPPRAPTGFRLVR